MYEVEINGARVGDIHMTLIYSATRAYMNERVLRARRPPRPAEVSSVVATLLDGLAGDRT